MGAPRTEWPTMRGLRRLHRPADRCRADQSPDEHGRNDAELRRTSRKPTRAPRRRRDAADARAGRPPRPPAGPVGSRRRRRRPRPRARPAVAPVRLADGALEVEAAGREHDELRRRLGDRLPGRREGAFARPPEHLVATGEIDHLGHPVPCRERRVEPFGDEHAQARRPRTSWCTKSIRWCMACASYSPFAATCRCRASVRIDSSISRGRVGRARASRRRCVRRA